MTPFLMSTKQQQQLEVVDLLDSAELSEKAVIFITSWSTLLPLFYIWHTPWLKVWTIKKMTSLKMFYLKRSAIFIQSGFYFTKIFYQWASQFGKISAGLEENCRFFANIMILAIQWTSWRWTPWLGEKIQTAIF